MDQPGIWVRIIMLVICAALITPGLLYYSRGNILRNIALWLGIFLLLGLIYQSFGLGETIITGQNPPAAGVETEPGLDPAPENSRPKLGDDSGRVL